MHRSLGLIEAHAGLIPIEPTVPDQAPNRRFGFAYHGLVTQLEQAPWKQTLPMGHQARVGAVISSKFLEIVGESVRTGEGLAIARQAGIERIPYAMYNPGLRKGRVDEPDI